MQLNSDLNDSIILCEIIVCFGTLSFPVILKHDNSGVSYSPEGMEFAPVGAGIGGRKAEVNCSSLKQLLVVLW
ncbi:unnamed protein product [Citrullus colocynthis]|uniref:Uncharacterized protein n=1 Tax=Citrullus colocynthis TaxID=252529 RepID=A0ABP0XXD9_9ROSI